MTTFTALTTLSDAQAAARLGEALESLDPTGVGVFEMEDGSGRWEVGAYFTDAPDEVALTILATAFDARPFAVSEVPPTDWVAAVRRELHPIRAGRFYLYGAHDADTVPDDAIPLLIEAAMAFGTGHHGTTQGCLLSLDALEAAPTRAIDVGCGTAVLAIAIAKRWGVPVLATDIDPVAVEVAQANAHANGVAGAVTCIEAAGFDHPQIAGPYDLVCANILMGPLVALAPDMARHTAPGAHAILSGLLTHQADTALQAYADAFDVAARRDLGEWSTLTLRRR